MVTIGENYVERVEKALVQTVVLNEIRETPRTLDNLWETIRNLGFDEKVTKDFVKDAVNGLTSDHAKEENGKFTITDDGREDVTKLATPILNVAERLRGVATGPTGSVGTPGTPETTRRTP